MHRGLESYNICTLGQKIKADWIFEAKSDKKWKTVQQLQRDERYNKVYIAKETDMD